MPTFATIKRVCPYCGQWFTRTRQRGLKMPTYCSTRCGTRHRTAKYYVVDRSACIAFRFVMRGGPAQPMKCGPARPGCSMSIKHWRCYIKEARAMLDGLEWQGRNRCVQLLGDLPEEAEVI